MKTAGSASALAHALQPQARIFLHQVGFNSKGLGLVSELTNRELNDLLVDSQPRMCSRRPDGGAPTGQWKTLMPRP